MSAGPRATARDYPTPRPRAPPSPPRRTTTLPHRSRRPRRSSHPVPPGPAPRAARSPRPDSIKAAKTRGPLRLHACFLLPEGGALRVLGTGKSRRATGGHPGGWAGPRAVGRQPWSLWAWLDRVGGV